MFAELSEVEEDDVEATTDDGSINLASEVAKALQDFDFQTLAQAQANMPTSEEVDPQEQQNKK
eukprot:8661402-Karenia_brevis.AAC.1